MNAPPLTPDQLAEERGLPISSVIWCAPLDRPPSEYTRLNIYAVGYAKTDTASVPLGYGTLIPDPDSPVSGVLHESDVHGSPRAPRGHRLFRVMSPSTQSGSDDEVKAALRQLLCAAEPVLFEHIGERSIPSYPPGYMASLNPSDAPFTRAGWFYSGVSITHVVAEAERIADVF
jgi:protoporphyrinogen oxidase